MPLSRDVKVLPRELPPLPGWAKPKWASRPPAGTDLVEIGGTEHDRADLNAARLNCLGRWYEERRAEYAQGKPLEGGGGC